VTAIAGDGSTKECVAAQAIMTLVFNLSFLEYVDRVPENQNLRTFETTSQTTSPPGLGKIYPNPNNGSMQFDYSLDAGQKGSLQIFDLTGKMISQYELSESSKSLLISEESLSTGVYLYRYFINGEMKSSDKLVIIK